MRLPHSSRVAITALVALLTASIALAAYGAGRAGGAIAYSPSAQMPLALLALAAGAVLVAIVFVLRRPRDDSPESEDAPPDA